MELKKTYENILDKLNSYKLFSWMKKQYQSLSKRKYLPFIIFMYLVAFTMFFYTLIRNQFTIPVSGDFVLQEIPFYFNGYDDWWTFFTTGKFVLWDDSGMLGVNNIGANSFYYLFNPFFLVLLIVPRFLIPQAQAFMMITKMVLAGLTMKLLLQKFKVKEETTWLISVAYAFCGWNLYYLWFNHFLEISVLFPLVLLGIEYIIKDQKPLLLIIAIFVSGLTNYFFLISFCFCGVLYAIFRYFQNFKEYISIAKERKLNKTKQIMDIRIEVIMQGIFAFAIGLMLAAVILFPCFSVALTNSRVTSQTYLTSLIEAFNSLISSFKGEGDFFECLKQLFDCLFKWPDSIEKKNILYPLIAFFTPNVSCFDSLVFAHQGYDNSYASCFIYTPLLFFFIPCLIQSLKKRAVSTIIGILGILLLMFTPFAYYCFSGFTGVAYARWYIFVTVISCLFIGVQYDKREEMKMWTLNLSFGIIIFIYGFLLYKSQELTNLNYNNLKEMDERTLYLYGEMVYLLILYLYLRKNYKKENLTYDLRYLVALEAVVMCSITLMVQGTANYNNLYHGQANIQEEVNLAKKLKEEDKEYYRMFSTTADRDGNNLGMMYGIGGLGTFHSVYNYQLEDFLDWSEVQYGGRNGWSMGVHEKRINLDEFLGVKYYLLKDEDKNVPFGFEKHLTTDDHVVYVNKNFIELGYAFDTIITTYEHDDYKRGTLTYQSLMSSSSQEVLINEKAYLTGAILYNKDYEEIAKENHNFKVISDQGALRNGLYFVDDSNLPNDKINVYYAEWNDEPYFHDNYTNLGSFSEYKTENLTWFSYLDIDTSHLNIGGECSTRGKCFVSIQARMGENLNITLYGEKDGVEYEIVSDHHMKHYYDKRGDRKRQRGFYVDDKVTRIKVQVLETMNNDRYLLKPYITYEYEDTYLQQIAKLKENPLTNIKHDVNSFTFDTNFNEEKFVVLQIPYDDGWSLKKENGSSKETIKIYKGQGGFVSFLAEPNQTHYVLEYQTPFYKEGMLTVSIGMTLLSAFYIGHYNFYLSKRKYEEMFKLS